MKAKSIPDWLKDHIEEVKETACSAAELLNTDDTLTQEQRADLEKLVASCEERRQSLERVRAARLARNDGRLPSRVSDGRQPARGSAGALWSHNQKALGG